MADRPTPPRREPPAWADDDTAFIGRAEVPFWDGDEEQYEEYEESASPPEPPEIDPAELEGLRSADNQQAQVRRVLPLADEPSPLVSRYMFATERYRGEWRLHLIHLAAPLSVAVLSTVGIGLGAGLAETYVDIPWLVSIAVLAWLATMAWVGWKVAYWNFYRFILTNKRLMLVHGIITRHVAMMPLLRVTDMKYEQTPMGRMLNYGTFVIESAGQDQALREVPHLPNPNELYLRLVEEMYDPGAVESRVDQPTGGSESESHPSGDA